MNEWINNLEDFKGSVGKCFHSFCINISPFKGMIVYVTKSAVLFYKRNEFLKVHYPSKIEYAWDKDNHKLMLSIKTNEYWACDERSFSDEKISFGMDMTAPFLKEQNWKPL